jgi:hypothetical protein
MECHLGEHSFHNYEVTSQLLKSFANLIFHGFRAKRLLAECGFNFRKTNNLNS